MIVAGHPVHIELKATDKDKADPLQLHRLHAAIRAGGYALLCCPENWFHVYNFLERLAATGLKEKMEIPPCLKLPLAK